MKKLSRILWVICWGAAAIGVVLELGSLLMMAITFDGRWLFAIYSSLIPFAASGVFAVLAGSRQRQEKNTAAL